MISREGQQRRTNEAIVQALPLSALESAASQRITNNTQLYTILTRLLAQIGHFTNRNAARISNYDGECALGRFTDLGNNRFLAFKC